MSTRIYSYRNIVEAYDALGIRAGDTVLVHSDLRRLFAFEDPAPGVVLDAHYRALREVLGEQGTVVVPTNSFNLCNTETVFDVEQTPSHGRGVLSEFVRKLPGARRSFHPFVSYAAIGPRAEFLTADVSRHAYGPETAKARLVESDAWCISIGLTPNMTCSTVHHVEQLMAVPYRYTKEFMHPVLRDGEVRVEPFYLHVWYRECELERNQNQKILDSFKREHDLGETVLGAGKLYAYRMGAFCDSAIRSFREDIYVWLNRPPEARPYRR